MITITPGLRNAVHYRRSLRVSLLAATFTAFVASQADLRSATLMATAGPPALTLTNASQNSNTLTVQQIGQDTVKISGDASFTKGSSGMSTIVLRINGTFDADTGDVFSEFYDFTFNLTGTGQVSWTLEGKVNFPFVGLQTVVSESSSSPLVGPSSQRYTGSKSAAAPFSAATTWQGVLTVNWTGGLTGDTLGVAVPNNSIDFRLAIPEPSSAMIFAVGAMGLISRRRR